MAKSKRRRARKKPFGATAKTSTRTRVIVAAVAVLLVLAGAWSWYDGRRGEAAFMTLVEAGQGALDKVERRPEAGRDHVAPGATVRYADPIPTSGPHDPNAVIGGVYDQVQRNELLVHSLEHGMIVVYYDRPAPGVLDQLRDWAGLYAGPFDGIVVAPKPVLDGAIVLTAWNRILRLDPFDPAAAAAFIDTFRGRGPERRVR